MKLVSSSFQIEIYNGEIITIRQENGLYSLESTSGYDTRNTEKEYKSLDAILRKVKDYEKMCKDEE